MRPDLKAGWERLKKLMVADSAIMKECNAPELDGSDADDGDSGDESDGEEGSEQGTDEGSEEEEEEEEEVRYSDEKVANRNIRVGHRGDRKRPLNDGQRPKLRGVRVVLSTGYSPVRGKSAGVVKRRRELISHPKSLSVRFATFPSLLVKPWVVCSWIRSARSQSPHLRLSQTTPRRRKRRLRRRRLRR
jgi:hypothetical protein